MRVEKLGKGSCYATVSVNGSVISIGTEQIDCSAEQEDSQKIIDLKVPVIDAYVASIVIPPKEYEIVETEAEESDHMEGSQLPQAKPLDMETVVVSLWPLDGIVIDEEETDNGNNS